MNFENNFKNSEKTEFKLPHVIKNRFRENEILFKKTFSLFFKILVKNRTEKPFAFSNHFLFLRAQNHHSNLSPKIIETFEKT